jgi:hypothetical protein
MQNRQDFHPVHQCNDGVFNAASGTQINLNEPTPDMIRIDDIAAALSKICRFGGQTNAFYSVAQHSVLVAALAPEKLKREGLMHDAAEAYLGDVIKPLKVMLGYAYEKLELDFMDAINATFGLSFTPEAYAIIKKIDMQVLELEHEALQVGYPGKLVAALGAHDLMMPGAWAWSPQESQEIFLGEFRKYFNQ